MVVVSGGWAKSVIYPNCGDVIVSPKMAAKAVLICRPNSHPFQERSLTLDQPVKIGRSVARARAAPNNAIFDCKVLSRNHALLWYENGKFYLQDTKSSNGTFVNNQRLSKGAEESPPREVCSGDIVQFGVDVMENSRKVTHGCIVATLKLYLPDGKEAKASPSTSVVSSVGVVPLEDLYTLNQYLQEALQREQQLEGKIATLQQLLDTMREASETSWKALIDEDRLLSRVEILENQLQMYSKNFAEDKLREELRKLQEDKSQYQGAAKESIRKILQEKLDAVQKLQDLERSLSNTEGDCSHLKEANERSQQDLQELALKYSLQQQKTEELASKLQETEDQHREVRERLEQEKQELQARLQEQLDAERALQLRLETLQADGDMAQRQLAVLQSHLQSLQPNEDVDTKIDIDVIKSMDSTGLDVDVILERIEPEKVKEGAVDDTQDEVEILRALVEKSEEELRKMRARMETLSQKLEESQSEEDLNSEQMCELQQRLDGLQLDLELKFVQSDDESVEGESDNSSVSSSASQAKQLKADITNLEELLAESRGKKQDAETERQLYQRELENAKIKAKASVEELNVLTQRLQVAQNEMLEKTESVTKLHEQMQWLETSADEVKFQVLQLQERLQDEQERSRRLAGEAETLRTQLMEAHQSAKQSRNEAERMRDRLRAVQDELHLATTSDDNRSQEEISLILKRCNDLEEINSRLKIDLQRLEEANLNLRTDLAAQMNELGTEYETSSELIECRLQRDKISRELSSLQEEMVFMKQCYSQCSDVNTQLSQEMVTLQEEYTNIIQSSAYGMYRYLLPLLVGFIAVCFGLQMYIFK